MFATWTLRLTDEGYFDGPESTIVERGGSAHAIWQDGSSEHGGIILGKVTGNLDNLGPWNFATLSNEEAQSFIHNNFTPVVDRKTGIETTLENALTALS